MQIAPNSGFPVLAYPECDVASPVTLSLVFKHDVRRAQATLCLLSSLFIHACEDAQTFILQYEADNIVPGKISLGPATILLPQERLEVLARESKPEIRTLSLVLKEICPVWCPPSSGPLTPRPGCEVPFHQLAKLAHALELHIVFDYKRLHSSHHASFQRLIEHPEKLSGFPVEQRYRQLHYKCADWSVFTTEDDNAHTDTDATTEDDEPPPEYNESNKRPMHVLPGPTSLSPPPKRVRLSRYTGDIQTSPTEQSSITALSPKPLQSPKTPPLAVPSPKPSSLHASSPKPPHSSSTAPNLESLSPVVPAIDLQCVVEKAVESLLPRMLDTLLPSLLTRFLTRLLTAPSPASSFSQELIAKQILDAPPPALSALKITLGEYVTRKIESYQETVCAHSPSHANHTRDAADLEVESVLEDGRLQLLIEKQDVVDEVKKVVEEILQAFRGDCERMVDYVEEEAELKAGHVIDHVRERLDELGHREKVSFKKVSLEQEREELRRNKKELRRDKQDVRRDKEDVRRDKEDVRRDKEDVRRDKKSVQRDKKNVQKESENLRREREILESDQRRFKSEKRRFAEGGRCGERGSRAGSAPR